MGLFDALFGKSGVDYTKQAADLWKNLDAPSVEDQKLILQQYVEQGVLTPEQAQAALMDSNAYDDMQLDSTGKNAQLDALRQLAEIGNEGGLTASDKAKLQGIQNQEQTASRGAREAIIANAQARGMGGSGLEMLSQMQNAQDAATRQSTRDLEVAAMGQERALQALQAAGALGGQIDNQQFGQQKAIADASNAIKQFNAANTQQVNLANTAANNNAQAANLQNKQNIANSNVDLKNQQQAFNKGLQQQNFQNQVQLTSGQSGVLQNQAAQADKDRSNNKSEIGGLIKGGAKIAASIFSDEDVKKDVEPFDASAFLDSLTGYKYRYKDEDMGDGEQVGVMAQDLEKEVPQMVEDTPHGKMVDYSPSKAGGPIMASLSDLHERLKQLEGR